MGSFYSFGRALRRSTVLVLGLLAGSHITQAQCQAGTGVTIVTAATASQYFSIGSGQTLCISPGVAFTGSVTLTSAGATINNYGTWQSGYNINGSFAVTINNFGSWPADLGLTSATINTTGTWTASQIGYTNGLTLAIGNGGSFTANLYANGSNGGNLTVTNAGTFNQTLGFPATGVHRFYNTSTGTATFANLYFNGGAVTLDNQNRMTVTNTLNTNNAALTNSGTLTTTGANTSTNSTVVNQGTWNAGALQNNGPFTNSGTLQATTLANNTATLTNNGTITTSSSFTNNSGATLNNQYLLNSSGDFTNFGTVTGRTDGRRSTILAQATSTNTGTFGATGLLDFCDATSTNSTNSGGFDSPGSGVSNTVTYCTRTAAAPLPVTLSRFRASREGAAVLLTWATATEIRNAGFRIERSVDNQHWEQRAFVAGQPTDYVGTTAYHWHDQGAGAKAAYYRLVQQDTDGKLTYAPAAYVPALGAQALTLLPNPAHGQVAITSADTEVPLLLFNGQGQLVRQASAGSTVISLADLPAGLYLVRVGAATERLLVE